MCPGVPGLISGNAPPACPSRRRASLPRWEGAAAAYRDRRASELSHRESRIATFSGVDTRTFSGFGIFCRVACGVDRGGPPPTELFPVSQVLLHATHVSLCVHMRSFKLRLVSC